MHSWQAAAPVALLYFPGSHSMQIALISFAEVPTGQIAQSVDALAF